MNLYTGAHAAELARAVRTVSAAHRAIGEPQLDELDHGWCELLNALDRYEVMGEHLRATHAIERYVEGALAAIEGASQ